MNAISKLRGMECKFSSQKDVWKFLKFYGIEFSEQYYFSAINGWAYYINLMDTFDFPDRFPPSYFQELGSKSAQMLELVAHLYPIGADKEKIDTYDDFLKSRCEMIVLIYDVCYVEVYCKDPEWTQKLLQSAKSIPNSHVEEKYPETDCRTGMYV